MELYPHPIESGPLVIRLTLHVCHLLEASAKRSALLCEQIDIHPSDSPTHPMETSKRASAVCVRRLHLPSALCHYCWRLRLPTSSHFTLSLAAVPARPKKIFQDLSISVHCALYRDRIQTQDSQKPDCHRPSLLRSTYSR